MYRFFKGETNPQEEEKIFDWLEADPENRNLFEAQREIFNTITIHAAGIAETGRERKSRRISMKRVARYTMGTAAVAALMVTAGVLSRSDLRNDLTGETMQISVPAGQRINVTLADGTAVWLNSETRMEYPTLFGSERRVRIEGEAQFDVAHDEQVPFIVETFACDVTVLGTRFNVNAESDRGTFTAALFEGEVLVSNKLSANESVILKPNDMVTLLGGRLRLGCINGDDEYLWPEGLISIGNIPFEQLMGKFEKYYDVKIVVENRELQRHVGYKGKMRISDGIDHALRLLQRTSDFTYEKDENTNTIYIK